MPEIRAQAAVMGCEFLRSLEEHLDGLDECGLPYSVMEAPVFVRKHIGLFPKGLLSRPKSRELGST